MNIVELVEWGEKNHPTGEQVLDKIRENMNDEEISTSLLFLVTKLSDIPFVSFDQVFMTCLTSISLVITERVMGNAVASELIEDLRKNESS